MTTGSNVKCTVCVVCEYVRHWDTHRINTEIGKLTDATLEELRVANRSLDYGYEDDFQFSFCFDHYLDDSLPEWFEAIRMADTDIADRFPFKRGFLALLSTITITQTQYRNLLRNPDGSSVEEGRFTDDELIYAYKDYVVSRLSEYSFLFSLAANIARPGSIQFTNRYLFQDNKLIRKIGGTLNTFDGAFDISQKYSWPPIALLGAFNVWDWLVQIPGFLNGESQSCLGRAIGALSYLLNDDFKDENELAIVWALIGLEALYGKGNVGLKFQLLEKTESLLGERTVFKKELGQMYDFRSRLIHGDKNFHYKGFERAPEDRFANELRTSEGMAIATLISTLQHMCKNKMTELKFRMTVARQPDAQIRPL